MADEFVHLSFTLFREERFGTTLDGIANTIELCTHPPIPQRVQGLAFAGCRRSFESLGHDSERTPHAGETTILREAAEFYGTGLSTRDLIDRVRDFRITDKGFVGGIVENDGIASLRVFNPSRQLLPGCRCTCRIVRIT